MEGMQNLGAVGMTMGAGFAKGIPRLGAVEGVAHLAQDKWRVVEGKELSVEEAGRRVWLDTMAGGRQLQHHRKEVEPLARHQ